VSPLKEAIFSQDRQSAGTHSHAIRKHHVHTYEPHISTADEQSLPIMVTKSPGSVPQPTHEQKKLPQRRLRTVEIIIHDGGF